MKTRLDARANFPEDMENYLGFYGWHFSKKMCQWAVSNMYRIIGGQKLYITPYTKEEVDTLLDKYKVTLEHKIAYDHVYVANMCKADFLGSSILDELHLVKYIKDVIDDPDAYDGMPFTRFYADCIGSGLPIMWSEML